MNARIAAVVVVIALILVLISNATFQVAPGSRALVLQFGRIVDDNYGPGLHFKLPFVQSVEIYDGRILTLDNQTRTFATADKKKLEIGYYAKWKIADPDTYYRATGGQELVAMDRLSAILNRGLRNEFSAASEDEAIVTAGPSLMAGLDKETTQQVAALGVKLVDLRLSNVHFPAEMLDSVYDHMRSERQTRATEMRAKASAAAAAARADANAKAAQVLSQAHLKAEKIRGEGDASAARVYASAYAENPDFFKFYRSLQAYRKALSKGGDVLVLSTQSPFFEYLHHGAAGR